MGLSRNTPILHYSNTPFCLRASPAQAPEKILLQAAQKDPEARRLFRDRVRETCPEFHEHANTNTNSREAISAPFGKAQGNRC